MWYLEDGNEKLIGSFGTVDEAVEYCRSIYRCFIRTKRWRGNFSEFDGYINRTEGYGYLCFLINKDHRPIEFYLRKEEEEERVA